MNCEFCSSPVHVWFQCPKKPDGWKPARLAKESTAARRDVQLKGVSRRPKTSQLYEGISGCALSPAEAGSLSPNQAELAGTQVLPVDTSPVQEAKAMKAKTVRTVAAEPEQDVQILRPGPKFNKNEYQCRYMREVYRPRLKAKKDAGALG